MIRILQAGSVVTLGVLLAACGSDASAPDARFACLNDTLPTTAPAAITVSGTTKGNVLNPTVLSGVEVIVSRTGTDTLGADTSSAPGRFSISVATGGTPVDGHLQLKKSGYLPTFAYPARPMAANDSTNVLMVTSSEFAALAAAAGVTPQAGKGFIGLVVADCQGNTLGGATVSSVPAGTVLYNAGSLPSSQAGSTASDGVAYIANVTAGNVTIMATANGHTLRQHIVNARADAITLTQIRP
jgi:hypothetical protein